VFSATLARSARSFCDQDSEASAARHCSGLIAFSITTREVGLPEAIDELDPLQRGSLVHDIQFKLFERLRARKQLPIRLRYLEQAREVLEMVITDVLHVITTTWPRLSIGSGKTASRLSVLTCGNGCGGQVKTDPAMFLGIFEMSGLRTVLTGGRPIRSRCLVQLTLTAGSGSGALLIWSSGIHPVFCG
jgi:hypothetical protein